MPKPRPLINFDWAVKRLLRSKVNFKILEGFLNELLKCQLKIEEVIDDESNKIHQDDKSNKIDMLAKLTTGELVIIEVQVSTEDDYFSHIIYYGVSKTIADYMQKGEKNSQVKKIYYVNIVYFPLGIGTDYIYKGTTSFTGMRNHDHLSLSKKQKEFYQRGCIEHIHPEYYLIKVNKFNEVVKNTLDEWIYFLKTDAIKDDFKAQGLAETKERLDYRKLSEDEQKEYSYYLENLAYQRSMLDSSYRSGKIAGKMEIEARSKARDVAIGKIKGELEETIKIAKNLKDMNIAIDVIQKATGLSIEEIVNA